MDDILYKHINELVSIDEAAYKAIVSYFHPVKYRKRQFVIQENQVVNDMFFVQKGLLKSGFMDDAGKEHILQFASENWWVSDFAAFYKQEDSTVAVECIEDCHLLRISLADLDSLCKAFPKMEHFFRLKSNLGYVALQKRILSFMMGSAKDRYENFCKQYPHLVQRLPKQIIANYLGLSRETLSRLQL